MSFARLTFKISHLRPDQRQIFGRVGNAPDFVLRPEHSRRNKDTDDRDAKSTHSGQQDRRLRVLKVAEAG